jgi:hypothetical protein
MDWKITIKGDRNNGKELIVKNSSEENAISEAWDTFNLGMFDGSYETMDVVRIR